MTQRERASAQSPLPRKDASKSRLAIGRRCALASRPTEEVLPWIQHLLD